MKYTLLKFPGFKTRAVTVSYDDGITFDKRLIEILDKNGLKGTFNLNSGLFGHGKLRLTEEQAVELYANSGHEVAIHGKKHLSLAEVPDAVVTEEVIGDRVALEKTFDRVIGGMAYANGSWNDRVMDILKKCGIEYVRTTVKSEKFELPDDWLQWAPTCHHSHPRLMELVDEFLTDSTYMYYWAQSPRVFFLWGHSYEFDDNDNWNVIEQFAERIGNRDDIWYATNGEICRYVQAFNSLQFSADGERVYNPTATDVYMFYFNENILVKSGETVKLK